MMYMYISSSNGFYYYLGGLGLITGGGASIFMLFHITLQLNSAYLEIFKKIFKIIFIVFNSKLILS